MPGLHAVLSPSAAKRWLTCPPSARLNEKMLERFGEKSSSYAEEGTKAHSLAELKLRHDSGAINDFCFDEQVKALGDVTPKMDWATNVYVDTVMQKYYAAKKTCADAVLWIEKRLDMSRWVPHCFGTGDAGIISDDCLEVIDYKNGSGVRVDAQENPQARLYGLGGINEFGDLYDFPVVRNTIIQPNLDHITEEEISRKDLLAWGESIKPIAQLAWEGKGEFKSGEHCRFCAARALCWHRAADCMKAFSTGLDTPDVIPDTEIPHILEVADSAAAWIKDVKEYALGQALQGRQYSGYKLVSGKRPPRKWSNPDGVVDQMSRAGYSDDQIYEKKLISVGDAEKLLGAQAFRAILGQYSAQGEGAPALVPETDKRPALNSAENAFADLVQEE